MDIHKVIHLVETYSLLKAVKKATALNTQSNYLDLMVIVAFLENILLITALIKYLCTENMENKVG